MFSVNQEAYERSQREHQREMDSIMNGEDGALHENLRAHSVTEKCPFPSFIELCEDDPTRLRANMDNVAMPTHQMDLMPLPLKTLGDREAMGNVNEIAQEFVAGQPCFAVFPIFTRPLLALLSSAPTQTAHKAQQMRSARLQLQELFEKEGSFAVPLQDEDSDDDEMKDVCDDDTEKVRANRVMDRIIDFYLRERVAEEDEDKYEKATWPHTMNTLETAIHYMRLIIITRATSGFSTHDNRTHVEYKHELLKKADTRLNERSNQVLAEFIGNNAPLDQLVRQIITTGNVHDVSEPFTGESAVHEQNLRHRMHSYTMGIIMALEEWFLVLNKVPPQFTYHFMGPFTYASMPPMSELPQAQLNCLVEENQKLFERRRIAHSWAWPLPIKGAPFARNLPMEKDSLTEDYVSKEQYASTWVALAWMRAPQGRTASSMKKAIVSSLVSTHYPMWLLSPVSHVSAYDEDGNPCTNFASDLYVASAD